MEWGSEGVSGGVLGVLFFVVVDFSELHFVAGHEFHDRHAHAPDVCFLVEVDFVVFVGWDGVLFWCEEAFGPYAAVLVGIAFDILVGGFDCQTL